MSGSRRKPGPLGPFVDGYRAWLVGRGYSPSVVVRSLITLMVLAASTVGVRSSADIAAPARRPPRRGAGV